MPMPRSHSVRRAGAMVGLLATALLAGAVPATAGSPFRLYHELGDSCVQLQNPPAGGTLTVIQKRGTTTVTSTTAPAQHLARACLTPLKPGDVVLVRRDGTTLHTATIPRITLGIDLATNVITGTAPTGGSYDGGGLYAEWHIAGFYWQGSGWSVTATPTTAGREGFSQDATLAYDLLGGDESTVDWFSGPDRTGDHYRKRAVTPSVIVGVVRSNISGTAKPGSKVTVRAFKGSTLMGTLTRTADPVDGSFSGVLKLKGRTVAVKPGWKVFHSGFSADTPILVVRAKDMTASDASDGTLSAACFAQGDWLLMRPGNTPVTAGRLPDDPRIEQDGLAVGEPIAGEKWQLWCDNPDGGAQIFSTVVQDAP